MNVKHWLAPLLLAALLPGLLTGCGASGAAPSPAPASAPATAPAEEKAAAPQTAAPKADLKNQAAMNAMKKDASIKTVFSTSPDPVKVNTSVNLTAKVTRNGTPVKDASVGFEIWKSEDTGSEPYQSEAKPDAEGSYILKGSFAAPGSYLVIVHVTTKDGHDMISAEFQVNA